MPMDVAIAFTAAMRVCLAVGINPVSFTCAAAVGGGGAYGGMETGGELGKWMGDVIYEQGWTAEEGSDD